MFIVVCHWAFSSTTHFATNQHLLPSPELSSTLVRQHHHDTDASHTKFVGSKLRRSEIRLGRASLNLEVKSTPPPGRVQTEKGRELNLCITKGKKNVEFLKNPERNEAKAREEGKGEI